MTFSELVTQSADLLGINSPDSLLRLGRLINARYKRVTGSIGLNVTRRDTVIQACTLGVQSVTFAGITHIERVIDASTGAIRVLREVTFDELRRVVGTTGDPQRYAIQAIDATSVTIYLDAIPQDARELTADGQSSAGTLSGSMVPAFPEDFHDILVMGVLADEYTRMEKGKLALSKEEEFKFRLGELRLNIAKSQSLKFRQNDSTASDAGRSGGASGGGSASGTTSYTQSGLISFMRAPGAPFAVEAGSDYVANLIAEEIVNQGVLATLDTVGTAEIDAGAVTLAKMASLVAGKLLGRQSGSAGAPEAITPTIGLTITNTTLNVVPEDDQIILASRMFG